MAKRIYLDEIKKKFSDAGVEWRDEYAEELLAANRDGLMAASEGGRSVPILVNGDKPDAVKDAEKRAWDTRRENLTMGLGQSGLDELPGVDVGDVIGSNYGLTTNSYGMIPDDGTVATRALRAIGKAGEAIPFNPFPYSSIMDPATTRGTKVTDFMGSMGGMVLSMGVMNPVTKKISGAITRTVGKTASPLLNKMVGSSIDTGVKFGAYNATMPAEDLSSWSGNIAEGVLTGAALGAAGPVINKITAGRPETIKDATRYVYDAGVITALELAAGENPEDALAKGLAGALAFSIAGTTRGQQERPTDRMSRAVDPRMLVKAQELVGGAVSKDPKLLYNVGIGHEPTKAIDYRPEPPRADSVKQIGPGPQALLPGGSPESAILMGGGPLGARVMSDVARPYGHATAEPQFKEPRTMDRRPEKPAQMPPEPEGAPLDPYAEYGMPIQEPKPPIKDRPGLYAEYTEYGIPVQEPRRLSISEMKAKQDRLSRRGDVTADAFGGQQVYEALRDKVSGRARRAKQRSSDTAIKEFSEGATDPIRGVAVSRFTSEYLKGGGKITRFRDLVDVLEKNADSIQGLETANKLEFAKDVLMRQRAEEGIEGEPTKAEVSDLLSQIDFPELYADIEAGKIFDKSPNWSQLADRALVFKGLGGGELANSFSRNTLRVMEEFDSVAQKATAEAGEELMTIARKNGLSEKNPDAEVAGQVQAYWDYKGGQTIDEFAASPAGSAILSQAKNPAAVVEFQREVRPLIEEYRDTMDRLSKLLNGKGVAVQDRPGEPGYLKRIDKAPGRFDIKGKIAAAATDNVDASGYSGVRGSGPERTFNPTAKHRTKGNENRDWNWFRAMNPYLKDYGNQAKSLAVFHNERVADIMRGAGLTKTGDSITAINQRHNNNLAFGVEQALNGAGNATSILKAMNGLALLNKKRFDNTRYRGNPGMAESQTRSLYTLFTIDPVSFNLAVHDLGNKKIWEANNKTTISRVKRSPHGGRRAEAGGTVEGIDTLLERLPSEKVESAALDWMINRTEEVTTQIALNFARHNMGEAEWNSLTPRERVDATNDLGKLTQQQYDVTGTAPIMNTKFIKGMFPAMRYRIDTNAGMIRQVWDPAIGDAFKGGNKKKAAETAKIIAGLTMADMAGLALKGYGSGGIIAGLVLWGLISGAEDGLPGQAAKQAKRVIRAFLDEDYSTGLGILFKEFLPLRGVQNAYESFKAYGDGETDNILEALYGTVFGKASMADQRGGPHSELVADPLGIVPDEYMPDSAGSLNIPDYLFHGKKLPFMGEDKKPVRPIPAPGRTLTKPKKRGS